MKSTRPAARYDRPIEPPDLTGIPFARMTGAVAEPTHRSVNRADPYWAGLWADGSQVSWESRALAERREASGFKPITVRDSRVAPEVCAERVRDRSRPARDSLGALAMWRTATTDQLAAFGGWVNPHRDPADGPAPIWSDNPSHLRLLWSSGMVERGRFIAEQPGLPIVWRGLRSKAVDELLAELPYAEWVRITAGQPWTAGPLHDRHNILGAELGLRIAEFCDVAAVLGESVAGHHLLDVTGRREKTTSGGGDMVVVRSDGLRIVVETTANNNPANIRRKVDRWLDLLAETDFDESGTVVCFVDANNPDARSDNDVIGPLRREIDAAIATRPDAAARRLAERIAVARWRWWFPSVGTATAGFQTLEAFRPTGTGEGRWQSAHLLDVTDVVFAPPDPAVFDATIANSLLLAGVPYWLRAQSAHDHTAPDLAALVARRSGLATLINAAGRPRHTPAPKDHPAPVPQPQTPPTAAAPAPARPRRSVTSGTSRVPS